LAVLIGTTIVDPDNSMDEMWVAVGAYTGFLCAVIFAALLRIAEGGRTFGELSLGKVCAWGAVSGLLVGLLPALAGAANPALQHWQWAVAILAPLAALSAASAVVTALVARRRR
jgi:hypothetical protein